MGSGLGGPARYLTQTTKCFVTAIELQEDLHKEAENLTKRCSLQQKLKHITGDFLQIDLGMLIAVTGWAHVHTLCVHVAGDHVQQLQRKRIKEKEIMSPYMG